MDGGNLGLLGITPPGDGGGAPSDGSTTAGSILTTNNDQDTVMSAEVSSPYPVVVVDDNLELGLGLSIGGGGGGGGCGGLKSTADGQYARILTAKDFPSLISKPNPPSSSSSFKNPNSSTSGTKRSASDSVSPSSVVGWPPIRKGHRLANQTKSPNEQSSSTAEGNKSMGTNPYSLTKKGVANKSYLPVKVNMDGSLIGRKVDLNAHCSYEMLAKTLEDMFGRRWSANEAPGPPKLLDGTSEFVLTYEDKDGDCMLVGDVPWQMFLGSVKRLRIIRNSDSNKTESRKERQAKNHR